MPLTNPQYEKIMQEYDEIRSKNETLLSKRKSEIRDLSPEYESVLNEISDLSFQTAINSLETPLSNSDMSSYKKKMKELDKKRVNILTDLGKPANYLDPIYTCHECKDTGLINGNKCTCFKKKAIELIYLDSNLRNMTGNASFENFNLSLYPDNDRSTNGGNGLSSLQLAKLALNACRDFVKDFDIKQDNILLYGRPGLGKTFLSTCIARELINTTHSVIYLTAIDFFNKIDVNDDHSPLLDCDLLIIDDLGTEISNTYTCSRLFFALNERLLRGKSTIFSTNLSLASLREIYTDRIFSRLISSCKVLKLTGNDIRIG